MVFAGAVFGGVVIVCLLSLLGWRKTVEIRLQKRLDVAQADLKKYQAIVDEVNQLEQTRSQLQARRDVIQTLLRGRLLYPRFFEDFMALLPFEIWIKNINTIPEAEGIKVTLTAESTSNFAIADWITNLQNSPLCKGVEMGTITTQEPSEEGRMPTYSFTVNFQYARGDN